MRFINKTALTVLVIALLVVSCDSLLDTKPAQSIDESVALENEQNIRAALAGAYDGISDDDMFGGEFQMESDLMAQDLTAPELQWFGTFEEPEQIWQKSILVENAQIAETWSETYDAINRANNVLSALDVIEDTGTRTQVEAEAKFIRGISYFNLIKLYAKPFSDGNAITNEGVPIVLTPTRGIDETVYVSRNTVAEVYTRIIDDLNDAEAGLPTSNGFFATSYTAAAFLSRVYLQQGDYANARDAAHRVIDSGEFSLTDTYAGAFNNAENSSEDVFAIQVDEQDGAHSLNTFYALDGFGGREDIFVTSVHIALYDPADERLSLIANGATYKWNDFTANIPVIRLAELLLTRAEAISEVGPGTTGATAAGDLNTVRARVGLAPILLPTTADILAERKLELAFEGQLLHDLKRTQQSVGSFAFDANELVWPIPQRERDVNPNLTQNPGYTGN